MATLDTMVADPPPLRTDQDGVVRVGGTRVTLDTVVHAFWNGETPEQIVQNYGSLELADVYAVITYYLRHRAEADAYLREREKQAEEVERRDRARYPSDGFRERLLARRS